MSRFEVLLTSNAVTDLEELYGFISANDSQQSADSLLDRVEELIASLEDNPNRGSYPPELLCLGLKEFRELHFKPYRIIYRVIGEQVFVYIVADGRRDMQTLLQRRLLT